MNMVSEPMARLFLIAPTVHGARGSQGCGCNMSCSSLRSLFTGAGRRSNLCSTALIAALVGCNGDGSGDTSTGLAQSVEAGWTGFCVGGMCNDPMLAAPLYGLQQ